MGHHNLGYIMLNHMFAYLKSTTLVLPYGCFLTKVFREFGLDLSTETESDKIYVFDAYTKSTMGRMKFVKLEDGEWRHMGDKVEADSDEDEDNNDIEGGCQPSSNLDIPLLQTDALELEHGDIPNAEMPAIVDEAPLYKVRAKISSLASRIEELVVMEDSRFSLIEARIDSYEMRLTSQYEPL